MHTELYAYICSMIYLNTHANTYRYTVWLYIKYAHTASIPNGVFSPHVDRSMFFLWLFINDITLYFFYTGTCLFLRNKKYTNNFISTSNMWRETPFLIIKVHECSVYYSIIWYQTWRTKACNIICLTPHILN